MSPTIQSQTSTSKPLSMPSYFPSDPDPARSLRARGKDKAITPNGGGGNPRDPWWKVRYELENKGSVARDHLALERTYLAWLRTSLALASIGIAVTQLFRLTTNHDSPSSSLYKVSAVATSSSSDIPSDLSLSEMRSLLLALNTRLQALENAEVVFSTTARTGRYASLAKPIGGVFIMLALLFLVMGSRRYFRIQAALMQEPQSKFPPSRRSVMAGTFCVALIVISSFAAILAR